MKEGILKPIGLDVDGNGLWTDGKTTWNSGEPLTQSEKDEVKLLSGGPGRAASNLIERGLVIQKAN